MTASDQLRNFKLVIEYDGTGFYGWQRQPDKPTIQSSLESVLSVILNQDIRIHGSGRTDAGVHARAQVAHFKAYTRIEPEVLKKGVNSLMKHPIVIKDCAPVSDEFHARYNARSKTYYYYILNRNTPCALGRDYFWHVNHALDIRAMNRCCDFLLGIHDFKAFQNTGSPKYSTTREIFKAHWEHQPEDMLVFKISASGFLKNMVRNIVGTLKDAGTGKISSEQFNEILVSSDRSLAGATAPARGLFLHQVIY
ncbi:MAG: tRNA pseudouridine(38-40) synthase TruA [Desulfobacter sp.]|nr:MAG: tRNA pseudouridine(38-40) synthase TruA [Desulfobacter sp.]